MGLFLETVFIGRGLVKMEGGGSRRGEVREAESRKQRAEQSRVESREGQRVESCWFRELGSERGREGREGEIVS